MIYIIDNFLPANMFNLLKLDTGLFNEFKTPNKSFWVKELPEEFIKYLCTRIGNIENKNIINILSFIREAKKNQDNEWGIHNDSIINNQQPDRAIVYYIESPNQKKLNGTAFWEHKKYGEAYTGNTNKQYDELIKNDYNNKKKWKLKSVIGYKPNRLLSYPCNYFHSKYPNEFEKSRKVIVMFYKTNERK